MLNTFAALCTLLPLAFSSPIVPRDDPFVPPVKFGAIAARSASPIHLQSINANGGAFWIGKNTTTYCPLANQTDCPPGKDTVFAVGNGGLGGAGLVQYPPQYGYMDLNTNITSRTLWFRADSKFTLLRRAP